MKLNLYKKIFLFALLSVSSVVLRATDYYLSTTGDDANNGTAISTPWKTLSKAVSTMVANDKLFIASGNYSGSLNVGVALTVSVDGTVRVDHLRMNAGSLSLVGTNSALLNVNDSFVLTNGIITVNSSSRLHALATCRLKGGNKNSFVIGGYAVHNVNSGGRKFLWHIGVANQYRPVQMEGFYQPSVLDHWFHADYIYSAPPAAPTLPSTTRNISKTGYWLVTSSAGPTEARAYEMSFYYDSVTADDGVFDAPKLQLLNSNGTKPWTVNKTGATFDRKGYITSNTTDSIKYFVLGNAKGGSTFQGGSNTLGDNTNPFAKFTYDTKALCVGDTIYFKDQSKNATGVIYSWKFGDESLTGSLAGKNVLSTGPTSKNPVHIYNGAGNFRVRLEIRNGNNVIDTSILILSVGVRPKLTGLNAIQFYRYPMNALDTFDDATICQGQRFWAVDNYDITFGYNPNNDFVTNLEIKVVGVTPEPKIQTVMPVPGMDTLKTTISQPGAYQIFATRTTSKGCKAFDVVDVIIYAKPAAAFTWSKQCETPPNTKFLVTNTTADPTTTNKIQKWRWEYEGQVVTGDVVKNPSTRNYLFSGGHPGVNMVKLIMETNFGCIDSFSEAVYIYPQPIIGYQLDKLCDGEVMEADATSSQIKFGGSIDDYVWKFDVTGAGQADTGNQVTYQYPGPGLYRNTLTLFSYNNGLPLCRADSTFFVRIHPKPTPSYQIKEVCFGDSTSLRRVIDRYPHRDSMIYYWFLDYNYIGSDTNFNYKLPKPGNYALTMRASSLAGCRDSAVGILRSFYVPDVSFNLDMTVPGNDTFQCLNWNRFTFDYNFGLDPYDTIRNSYWDFGDSITESPVTNNYHGYSKVDTFTVKLFVDNVNGCADSAYQTVYVWPSPVAGFTHEGICMPDTVVFTDTISTSIDPIVKRFWDFGNGKTDTNNLNISRNLYMNATPVTVTYVITTDRGCVDSADKLLDSLIDIPKANWQIIAGSMPLCKGDSAFFEVLGGDSVSWKNDLDTSRLKAFNVTGTYVFRVYNGPGTCFASDSVQVYAYPPADIQAYADTTIFRGRQAQLRLKNAYSNIKWSPSNLLLDSLSDFVVTKRLTDSTVFYVTALDSNGCPDLDSVIVRIIDPPLVKIPNIITPSGDDKNQTWNLIDIPDLHLFDIVISDRQGKRVYSTSNYENDWAATDQNGNPLPDGVYFYYMKNRQTNQVYRGYIQVIK